MFKILENKMIKIIINKIYGYFVDLSKVFSRKNLNKFISKELHDTDNLNKVLIIGAGGRIHKLVEKISLEKSFELISMDINKNYNPDIISDICEYKFTHDEYDLIIMPEVLQAIPTPHKAIQNILTGIKKGGSIIITVPFIFPIVDRPHDYFRFTKYGLNFLLKDFSEIIIFERNSWIESINVLCVRLIMNNDILSKIIGTIFIILAYINYPFVFLLGKLLKSDYLTTGYNVSGKK